MDNTIIVATISAVSAFLIALIPYFLQKKEINSELKNKPVDVDVELFKFNELRESVDSVLANTKADRFLILMSHNGKEEMRFATAIYEQHKNTDKTIFSFGATNKYIKIEFDDEYRSMLKVAEKDGIFKMETEKMPDCLLKSVYITEKVRFSNCYFIKRYPEYKSKEKDLLLYCTLASHSEQPFDVTDEVKFKTFVDFLKNELFVD